MRDFKTLKVWEKSHKLTLEVYRTTRKFPKDEIYNLTSQFRRAAYSIGLNISEGCGRNTDLDFSRFLVMAMGSANEVEYCVLLSKDLEYISSEDFVHFQEKIEEIKKMLTSLIDKLKGKK
ncbi:conserved hypothetical protein [uncultured Paludibacter sp.]|nr:conserved hypothetical protein [uncultured Paludibacter sp.]